MSRDQERAESLVERLMKKPKGKGPVYGSIVNGCIKGQGSLKTKYPIPQKKGRKS